MKNLNKQVTNINKMKLVNEEFRKKTKKKRELK